MEDPSQFNQATYLLKFLNYKSGFFIEAGAKTVLYTSWNIDSESAKIFMTETFKTGVGLNLQISEAISSTMKKFERGDFGEKYRHPFYWAPYKVFGVD